jgi:rRNA maturation endonuclease Nob1
MTITQTIQKEQQRFFCENCKREVFLSAKYCDGCGGKIEWPKRVQKIITSWNKSTKHTH